MSGDEEAAGVSAVGRGMRMDPRNRMSRVVDLFAPGYIWLQTIIDDGDADFPGGVEPPNVGINIFAADAQGFVARIQPAAVNENHYRPVVSVRQKKIEAMFGVGT